MANVLANQLSDRKKCHRQRVGGTPKNCRHLRRRHAELKKVGGGGLDKMAAAAARLAQSATLTPTHPNYRYSHLHHPPIFKPNALSAQILPFILAWDRHQIMPACIQILNIILEYSFKNSNK